MASLLELVNQSAPSGPAAILKGPLIPALVYIVTMPDVVILPIELLTKLVNQRAPSGPVAMPKGPLMPAPSNIVILPVVVILPIALFP